jgi:hypothetical protein
MKATEKLNQMIRSGSEYYYHGKKYRFLNFTERAGNYIIYVKVNGVDQKLERETPLDLENFLRQCIEVKEEEIVHETEVVEPSSISLPDKPKREEYIPELLRENKDTFKSLAQMLFEDVKKVRENPEYVNQAKQAANTANSIINLVKVQLEILKKG